MASSPATAPRISPACPIAWRSRRSRRTWHSTCGSHRRRICRRPFATSWTRSRSQADEGLLADYPRTWPARVTRRRRLARHERTVTHVPGDPARPFDRARVRDKFLRFVGPVIGTPTAEHILARCGDALATGEFAALVAEIESAAAAIPGPEGSARPAIHSNRPGRYGFRARRLAASRHDVEREGGYADLAPCTARSAANRCARSFPVAAMSTSKVSGSITTP